MLITGIVAEYNPFHNGHLYQIQQVKKHLAPDYIVIVMSGNFTQRGLPAIKDKFIRTQMALDNGADLVIELPTVFATSSAEHFAHSSVALLHQTGIVNTICFGAESNDTELMKEVATTLTSEPYSFKSQLKNYLQQGMSFPKARQHALIDSLESSTLYTKDTLEAMINSPNNILGIEYTKALLRLNSSITPFVIERKIAHYHDQVIFDQIASATAIRKQFYNGNTSAIQAAMPYSSYHYLKNSDYTLDPQANLWAPLQYKFIFSTLEDLYSLWDIPKNLCHSIFNAMPTATSFESLVDTLTSKTYSRATVQRSLLRILLDVKPQDLPDLKQGDFMPYIRVLGCSKRATHLLSLLNQHASVPVITNLGKDYPTLSKNIKTLLDYDIKATNLYYLLHQTPSLYQSDFSNRLIISENKNNS